MLLHRSLENSRKGFTLALTTSLMWGLLPIALKIVLSQMDPITLTWYRFSIAALLLNGFLLLRGRWPTQPMTRQKLVFWLVACFGLVGNHSLYVMGLNYLSPTAATVIIQLGPVFLLLAGIMIFKEAFSLLQRTGFLILLAGMILFFKSEIYAFRLIGNGFLAGSALIVTAAVSWVLYAIAQKQLLMHYSSQQIVSIIYLSGTLILLAASSPASVFQLDSTRFGAVIFCGINTLIAYGCFSEALQNWAASRVGAVLSIIPVLTLVMMQLIQLMYPDLFTPEPFTFSKIAGAGTVMAGSMMCALGKKENRADIPLPAGCPSD